MSAKSIQAVFAELQQIEAERQREIQKSWNMPPTPREIEAMQRGWDSRRKSLVYDAQEALRERKVELVNAAKAVKKGKAEAADRNAQRWDASRLSQARDRARAKVQNALLSKKNLGETTGSNISALLAEADDYADAYEKRALFEAVSDAVPQLVNGTDALGDRMEIFDLKQRVEPKLEALEHSDEQRYALELEAKVGEAFNEYVANVSAAEAALPDHPSFDETMRGAKSKYTGLLDGIEFEDGNARPTDALLSDAS